MSKLPAVAILLGTTALATAVPAAKARITFGAATIKGTFDATVLAAAVKKTADTLDVCYQKAAAKTPELKGMVTVTFTIGADGKVAAASATGMQQEIEACVVAALGSVRLAKPKNGKPVDVSYPITFEPPLQVVQGGAFASITGPSDTTDENIYGGLIGTEAGEMNGGLGVVGGGGGGTGWGTIGTGRYGTIGGGGSGYGVGGGRGGMRGRVATVPTISFGQPTVKGDLDKAIIRRYIKRNIQKLTYCYEKELLAQPTIQGLIVAEFTINGSGIVAAGATAKGIDPSVEACVTKVIQSIEFPKPKNGNDVTVTYPFTMRNPNPPPVPAKPAKKPDAKPAATKPAATP